MNKQKKHLLIADFLGLAALVLADQFTKYIAVIHLKDQPAIPIIDNVLELNYLENRGAAFGMLQNQKVFFVFVAILILTVIGYVLFKAPEKKKYTILHVLLVMIASGALGNMIDRLRFEYVVDFISFVLINFPIFNVADIYVTVATVALVILLLFVYQEDDLNFISFKQKKFREVK